MSCLSLRTASKCGNFHFNILQRIIIHIIKMELEHQKRLKNPKIYIKQLKTNSIQDSLMKVEAGTPCFQKDNTCCV